MGTVCTRAGEDGDGTADRHGNTESGAAFDECIADAPAGSQLDDLRQLSDKYGKVVSLDLAELASAGDRLAEDALEAYRLCEALIRDVLEPKSKAV